MSLNPLHRPKKRIPPILIKLSDSPTRIAKGVIKITLEFIMILTSTAVLYLRAINTALPIPNIPVSAKKLMSSGLSTITFRVLVCPFRIM